MPIDSLIWSRHLRRDPYLFHVTPAQFLDDIFRKGLIPGSERGHFTLNGFHRTREGHVYLCSLLFSAIVEVPEGPRALLRVDLRELDPERVDPDEDAVQGSCRRGRPWVSVMPPESKCDDQGVEEPGQAGALATWADTTPGFDGPEVTRKSLDDGRIAYRGTVPASAVEVWHYPSRPAEQFLTSLEEAVPGIGTELGSAPDEDFAEVEVARAIALGRTALAGVVRLASSGELAGLDPTSLRRETGAAIAHRLGQAARVPNRQGDFVTAELLAAGADVATAVGEIDLFWLHNKETCRQLGKLVARVVDRVREAGGVPAAKAVAQEAFAALRVARAE